MTVAEQVALAIRRAEPARPDSSAGAVADRGAYRRTPSASAYALGWVVANAIVARHYRTAAIDVLPCYDPARGWSRFVITRRASCWHCADDPMNRSIALGGAGAPTLVLPEAGVRLALRGALGRAPELGVRSVLDRLSPPPLPAGDHANCWHEVAEFYPTLYGAVTELVLQHRDVVAAREVFVDDRELDGAFHPLYLLGFATSPRAVYDWFAVETGEYAAYVRIHGNCAVYQTDAGGWSTVKKQLVEEDREGVKRRLRAWLRIAGRPDPAGVD